MIAIAGGTGLVGTALTKALLAEDAQVRVLTRDPGKARVTFGSAPEIVGVDFDDFDTLVAAFAGSEQAFLSTGTSDRQVRDEIALIDAAVKAGVSHLVNLSVGGAGDGIANNVLEWHTEIDAYVATKDVTSTLVRPATYTDTVVGVSANFVTAGAWGGAAGTGRVSLTDTRDVAAASAVILREGPDQHAGKIYELSGPSAVTMADVARYISDGIGSTVEYHDRIEAEQRAVLESVGVPALLVDVLLGLDALTASNIFAEPTSTVADLTGVPARSVAAWVDEHIALFKPPVAS